LITLEGYLYINKKEKTTASTTAKLSVQLSKQHAAQHRSPQLNTTANISHQRPTPLAANIIHSPETGQATSLSKHLQVRDVPVRGCWHNKLCEITKAYMGLFVT
jgi:hypothetical protein